MSFLILFIIFGPLFLIALVLDYEENKGGRMWKYESDRERVCLTCDRREIELCRDYRRACPSWWEATREGNGPKCTNVRPDDVS